MYPAQIGDEYQNQGVKPSAGQEAAFVLLVVLASGQGKGGFQLTRSNHSPLRRKAGKNSGQGPEGRS